MNSVPPCDPRPGERWKPIPGFETLYLVSNRAASGVSRVITSQNQQAAVIPRQPVPRAADPGISGYRVTALQRYRRTNWQITVHQLVMLTFVGPCPEGQEVRHLDGNPFNNRWEPGNRGRDTRGRGKPVLRVTPGKRRRHARARHCELQAARGQSTNGPS